MDAMTLAVGVLAFIVAIEYAVIGLYIVPRLSALVENPTRYTRAAQFGAAFFLVGCALTHSGLAIHAFTGQIAGYGNPEHMLIDHLLPHLMQVIGGATFIGIAWKKMDVRFNAKGTAVLEREREHLMARLTYLATRDELTGLYNRRAFNERIEEHQRRVARYGMQGAILYLDLDGFKEANDTFGHSTGDRVLVDVADALRSTLRESDVIGRMGGDEFAILLPQADHGAAVTAATAINLALRKVGPEGTKISASVGIAVWGETPDPHLVLDAADEAMYEAKRRGGDRYYVRIPKRAISTPPPVARRERVR